MSGAKQVSGSSRAEMQASVTPVGSEIGDRARPCSPSVTKGATLAGGSDT